MTLLKKAQPKAQPTFEQFFWPADKVNYGNSLTSCESAYLFCKWYGWIFNTTELPNVQLENCTVGHEINNNGMHQYIVPHKPKASLIWRLWKKILNRPQSDTHCDKPRFKIPHAELAAMDFRTDRYMAALNEVKHSREVFISSNGALGTYVEFLAEYIPIYVRPAFVSSL